MFFKSIEISNYLPLETKASIKKFSANFIAPVVIFIGDNGCGKSSIFQALTPYGQDKDLFHKSGYLSLGISHEDSDYQLGVDYSEKHSYFFEREEQILNESGNVTDQVSLSANLLGYSKELDKLLRMNYRMSDMSKKERKEFLMFFNPYDLSMVLEYQKKLSSLLRSIRANIKHLSQRKLILEDKAISEEELRTVGYKVATLEATQDSYRKAILILEEKIKEIQRDKHHRAFNNPDILKFDKEKSTVDFYKVISEIKDLWLNNSSLYHQHHFLPDEQIKGKLSRLTVKINEFENEIKTKLTTLEKYQTYRKLDLEKEVTPRKERLLIIEKEMMELSISESIPDLNEELIGELISEILPALRVVLDNLSTTSGKILNPKQLNLLRDAHNKLFYKLQTLKGRYEEVSASINTINTSLRSKETFPMECNVSSCTLRNNIEQKITSLRLQLTHNEKTLEELTNKIKKLQVITDRYHEMITNQESVSAEIEYLLDLFKSSRWLVNFLCSNDKLFTQLNTGITFMIRNLIKLKDELQSMYQKKQLMKERTTILFELSKLEDPNIPVKELIETVTDNMEQEVSKLQSKHASMVDSIGSLSKMSEADQKYHQLLSKAKTIVALRKEWLDYFVLQQQETLYGISLDILKEQLGFTEEQLRNLSILKQEQENIHLILKQEIIPSLEDLTIKEKDYAIIEQALDPADGFPKSYLLSYLNNIISNTNAILAQTWNDDLSLEMLTAKDDIDFTFKRRVNGHVASDIKCCSLSQKDIINIAWNLAMVITLGYGQHYPVFLDECDAHFDEGHRERLIGLIANLIRTKQIKQIFLINHHAALSSGLTDSQTICLSSNNISVPEKYNEQVMIAYK